MSRTLMGSFSISSVELPESTKELPQGSSLGLPAARTRGGRGGVLAFKIKNVSENALVRWARVVAGRLRERSCLLVLQGRFKRARHTALCCLLCLTELK